MSFGTSLRRYYRGDELVAMVDGTGAKRFFHFDQQGTTQCLTDPAGVVTDRFASDAWGAQVKRTGASINRHWYIGSRGYYQPAAVEDRLQYVRLRMYSPKLGSWLSVDKAVSTDRYSYAAARPSAAYDPLGLWAKHEVHGECTFKWAWETQIFTDDECCPFIVFSDPLSISTGAEQLDHWSLSAALLANWPTHFNYQDPDDWPKVIAGQSLSRRPDTREQFFKVMRSISLAYARSGSCTLAMIAFGMGLHSVQDTFSHADNTPVEHRDARNAPYIDNPDRDRGAFVGLFGFKPDIPLLDLLFSNASARVYTWPFGRERIQATENRSRSELRRFLLDIQDTTCVTCVQFEHKPLPRCPR